MQAKLAALGLAWVLAVGCACDADHDSQEPSMDANAQRLGQGPVGDEPVQGGDPWRDERLAMVAEQIEARGIRDPAVLAAMRAVPRHAFVPDGLEHLAYDDGPLGIGSAQTISQPYIVARMTEALRLAPDDRALEVGTGSGYQAAVLAQITPHVYSIEIVPELAERAAAVLRAQGYDTVALRVGDGYAGWPDAAPFDAIIVTAAPDHVPPALVEQLAPGGRLVIPVGGRDAVQQLQLIERDAGGALSRSMLDAVRFVPMTGAAEG